MSSQAKPTTGGCLCGQVRYELETGAEPQFNVICHCENCKKVTGSQMVCNSAYLKNQFTLQKGEPAMYADSATESGSAVHRHFCPNCGSSVFITVPKREDIVAVCSGSLDKEFSEAWVPNLELFIETKNHWLPEFPVVPKEGIASKRRRGY